MNPLKLHPAIIHCHLGENPSAELIGAINNMVDIINERDIFEKKILVCGPRVGKTEIAIAKDNLITKDLIIVQEASFDTLPGRNDFTQLLENIERGVSIINKVHPSFEYVEKQKHKSYKRKSSKEI